MEPTQTSYKPVRRKPAHETLEKMLVAAEDQLREQGLESFTVQSVLQRAGLSVGAFYARFPDKTAILRELQERVHGRVDPLMLSELAALTGDTWSLEEAVDKGFGAMIRHVLRERELFRAFMMLSVFDTFMSEKADQFNWARKRAISALLVPHRSEIGHPDAELAIDSAYAIYSSTMRGRLVYYSSADQVQFGATEQKLFDDLKQALALFLRGPAATAPHTADSTATNGRSAE
jgi:AcrR family transcriptional regulator